MPLTSRGLVFGLELSSERPVGPFPVLFAPWLVEPVPFPPRLPAPRLEEPETPPPLPPWPLGPKNLLPPLAARPSLLLLALLGLSLRLFPPAPLSRAQCFWVVNSTSAAPSSRSRHNCLFDKDSSKMCAHCQALKSPYLPVSVPFFVTI